MLLTLGSEIHNAYTQVACDSFSWHGFTYTASGNYLYNYGDGCGSADTLHLTINTGTHNSVTQSACDSLVWHGVTYRTTGNYTFSYTNRIGCPSVDTLHLVISSSLTSVPEITCPGNRQIACNTSLDPSVTGLATAIDQCDSITIVYHDSTVAIISNDIISGYTTFRRWIASDPYGNADTCVQVITRTGCNGIFPTATTCSDFATASAASLTQLCYKPVRNKITVVTPGVFFYYVNITAPSASFCINIGQSNNAGLPSFQIQKNQMLLYGDTCIRQVAGVDVNSRTGEICITNATAGARYILSVKFDSKSIENTQYAGLPPVALYRFVSRLASVEIPGTVATVLLDPNCNGAVTKSTLPDNLPEAERKTTIIAYPNPYATIINFRIDPVHTATGKLEAFDLLGRKLATIYEGMMIANQPIQLKYTPPVTGTIIYRLTTGNTVLHGKLIQGDIHKQE
jgi:hypothetical protein